MEVFCFYDLCVYTNILVSKDFYFSTSLVIPIKCYYFLPAAGNLENLEYLFCLLYIPFLIVEKQSVFNLTIVECAVAGT